MPFQNTNESQVFPQLPGVGGGGGPGVSSDEAAEAIFNEVASEVLETDGESGSDDTEDGGGELVGNAEDHHEDQEHARSLPGEANTVYQRF